MNNWREEDTLNLTSDVSSIESDKSNTSAASTLTATVGQQDLTSDHVAVDNIKTSTAPSAANFTTFSQTFGRLSLSQPDLPAKSTPLANFTESNMSTGNIASINRSPHHRIPLIKTVEENKTLKEEIAVLKSMLNVERYKVAELNALQPRNVQDILEEYYSLQMSKFDVEEERKQIAEAKRETQAVVHDMELKLGNVEHENQALIHQCDQYKQRIADLEAALAKIEDFPSSLDALKGDDSDWTIRSEGYIISEELRARLTEVEKENNLLRKKIEDQQKELDGRNVLGDTTSQSKTFVVGGGCDVETLLQRIDGLESRLHDEQEERNKTSCALVAYMSRCHALEKKLRNTNLSYANLSFSELSKEEVLKLVEKIRDLLLTLGKENKELRKECTKLLGLNGLGHTSADSSGEIASMGECDLEKSRLLAENFEKKQQEVLNILKSLTDNVTNFDESVINILRGIGDASDGEQLRSEVAFIDNNDSDANMVPLRRRDIVTCDNISAMNASLFELMNRSLNTSKDIINFKEKLDSLRGVMQRMFEILRSSGILFEDILENLGSGNDEMRQLADRIRSMKFEWDNVIDESRVFLNVIEETSQSVSKMQHEISFWEHSLNETFRMDYSIAHTTTQCFSAQIASFEKEKVASTPDYDIVKMRTLLSAKEEETVRLQSVIEKIRKDYDEAICSGDNLRVELKQLKDALFSVKEERDRLCDILESNKAEMELLRKSLEEQLSANEQVQQDVKNMRDDTEALLKEIDAKEVALADKDAELSLFKKTSNELKLTVLQRETEAEEIRAAFKEEQERRENERKDWKAAIAAAEDTSSALRHDLERIRKEFTVKEETIHHLSDQLQIAKENNLRFAEVVSEYASTQSQDLHIPKDVHSTAVGDAQRLPKIPMMKSRDSQTELTYAVLVKMQSDSLNFSSEMNVLRLAYDELLQAVSRLVVKDIEPIPNPVNISWMKKSCKELSRLIHHERRRRENQANEVAEMASKLEEVKHKCYVDRAGDACREVCTANTCDVIKHSAQQKVFDNPMRQTLFVLTTMAMDLVKSLRKLSSLHSTGHQVSFLSSIELARKLRNELNDRLLIVRAEKENDNKHCVADLIHMVRILERDNHLLLDNIKVWKSEYEALSERIANNPELVERIATQLRSIHAVMGESRRACGLLKEAHHKAGQSTSVNDPAQ